METISSCVVKKCLINIFKDLAPASDQFFRHLSQFFCVLRELLENVIKKEARGVPSILRSFYVQRGWKRLEKSIKETLGGA